jgi:hypothetical protein
MVLAKGCTSYIPTLTAVFVSSSDALLPPPVLLCTLMRLLLLGAGRTMALKGRAGIVPGDGEAGGELAMSAAGKRAVDLVKGFAIGRLEPAWWDWSTRYFPA